MSLTPNLGWSPAGPQEVRVEWVPRRQWSVLSAHARQAAVSCLGLEAGTQRTRSFVIHSGDPPAAARASTLEKIRLVIVDKHHRSACPVCLIQFNGFSTTLQKQYCPHCAEQQS